MTEVISNITPNMITTAKEAALAVMTDEQDAINSVFDGKTLEEVETGIRDINNYATKCWLLSALSVYSIIYDGQLYAQSGLTWEEYTKHTNERLGIDRFELSVQLSSARFFIKYNKKLLAAGWNPEGSRRKLEKAQLALELSKDVDETIKHLVNDSWANFAAWYSSLKNGTAKALPTVETIKGKYETRGGTFYRDGTEILSISKDIPTAEQLLIKNYIKQLFDAIEQGYEPAIIPVYDKTEASRLVRLRDKSREKK